MSLDKRINFQSYNVSVLCSLMWLCQYFIMFKKECQNQLICVSQWIQRNAHFNGKHSRRLSVKRAIFSVS